MMDAFVHINILLEKNSLEMSETSVVWTANWQATCGPDTLIMGSLQFFKLRTCDTKKPGNFGFSPEEEFLGLWQQSVLVGVALFTVVFLSRSHNPHAPSLTGLPPGCSTPSSHLSDLCTLWKCTYRYF